jgi:hypothetical protein
VRRSNAPHSGAPRRVLSVRGPARQPPWGIHEGDLPAEALAFARASRAEGGSAQTIEVALVARGLTKALSVVIADFADLESAKLAAIRRQRLIGRRETSLGLVLTGLGLSFWLFGPQRDGFLAGQSIMASGVISLADGVRRLIWPRPVGFRKHLTRVDS